MKRNISGQTRGFALPSILIASVVMLIVLLSAVSATAAVSKEIDAQYYKSFAKEAAQAGLARATSCISMDGNVATWSNNSLPLRPDKNCNGSQISGGDAYVYSSAKLRTTFNVGSVTITPSQIQVKATGTVELLRASNNAAVAQSYAYNISGNVPLGTVTSTFSGSGISQVCGIIDAQTWCWGSNSDGQLGNGTTTDTNIPVRVSRDAGGLSGKIDKYVAVGNLFACIVTTDNKVYCMGYNGAGQLGNGTTSSVSVPTAVDTSTGLAGKTITDISANESSACVIASGDVYCWGGGGYGKLGNGSTSNQTRPVRVSTIGTTNGLTVTALAATPQGRFSCAVAAGKAYCWGENDRGQLGDQTTSQRTSPVAVYDAGALSGKTVVGIAAAGGNPLSSPYDGTTADRTRRGHACARTSDGGVYCWGSNQYGQMGQGTASLTIQGAPVKVNGLLSSKTVTQIATAYGTPCALASDNTMYCWGQNSYGVIGDGTTTHRYSPTAVTVADPGLLGKTITLISGGVNRNCAIASGSTYCWGNNNIGQIGDGTYTNRYTPTEATLLKKRLPIIYF